jgi:hypothetical protein
MMRPASECAGAGYCGSGLGFCESAHASSHLIAAARDGKRCLKRKSSSFFSNDSSTRKLRNGFSDAAMRSDISTEETGDMDTMICYSAYNVNRS